MKIHTNTHTQLDQKNNWRLIICSLGICKPPDSHPLSLAATRIWGDAKFRVARLPKLRKERIVDRTPELLKLPGILENYWVATTVICPHGYFLFLFLCLPLIAEFSPVQTTTNAIWGVLLPKARLASNNKTGNDEKPLSEIIRLLGLKTIPIPFPVLFSWNKFPKWNFELLWYASLCGKELGANTAHQPTDRPIGKMHFLNITAPKRRPDHQRSPEVVAGSSAGRGGFYFQFATYRLVQKLCPNLLPALEVELQIGALSCSAKKGNLATETLPNPTLAMSVYKSCLCSLKSATTDEGSERTPASGRVG